MSLTRPAHLSIPLITGLGTGTEACGIGSVFPPGDLWIGMDTYSNCTLTYDILLKSDWWDVTLILFVLTDEERDRTWWPALSGHWLPCTRCCQYLLNSSWSGGLAKMGHFWHHTDSLGYLKKIWIPVVNIQWCPWTLKGLNIELLTSIIEC